MRESIGGIWIINIILFFMVIAIAYLGITVNYTKSLRFKNLVVTTLEETGSCSLARERLVDRMHEFGFNSFNCDENATIRRVGSNTEIDVWEIGSDSGTGARSCRFGVSVPLDLVIPVINQPVAFNVTGETRTIFSARDSCI